MSYARALTFGFGLALLALSACADGEVAHTSVFDRENYGYAKTTPEIRPSPLYGGQYDDYLLWSNASAAPRYAGVDRPIGLPYSRDPTSFPFGDSWPFDVLQAKK